MIAEIACGLHDNAVALDASMRPRSDDRGNKVEKDDMEFGGRASMRPRSDDRGNVTGSVPSPMIASSFNEAAIR